MKLNGTSKVLDRGGDSGTGLLVPSERFRTFDEEQVVAHLPGQGGLRGRRGKTPWAALPMVVSWGPDFFFSSALVPPHCLKGERGPSDSWLEKP